MIFYLSLHIQRSHVEQLLSGRPAKSGPLDFATKNSFPFFFVSEEARVGIYQNRYFCFSILFLSSATSQKRIEPVAASRTLLEKLKLSDFGRRAAKKRMPARKICSSQFS